MVVGFRWGPALIVVGVNIGLLAIIYLFTSFGVIPLTRWAALRVVSELGPVFSLLARALPLLLIFTMFLFINAEVWMVAHNLNNGKTYAATGLFVLLAVGFLVTRIPGEIGEVMGTSGGASPAGAELRSDVAGTPGGVLYDRLASDVDLSATRFPLTRRESGNVGLVVLIEEIRETVAVRTVYRAFLDSRSEA